MKYILTAVMALSLLNSAAAMADPDGENHHEHGNSQDDHDHGDRGRHGDHGGHEDHDRHDHDHYDHDRDRYHEAEYRRDGGDHDQRWRQRYSRTYTYNDDSYYQECHRSSDPAGVLAGAVIGGLLGNAAGHGRDRAGTTIVGVIAGGAVGAALTSHLDCDDRSYAYKSYSDGFNAGRPNAVYRWNNPNSDHRGEFHVINYYNDPDGFRCSNYSQIVYVEGRAQEARGRACRQPDGVWAIVD